MFFFFFNFIKSLYTFMVLFFYQNFLFLYPLQINNIHDLKFSLPFIRITYNDKHEKYISTLPKFLVPGSDLNIFHRNTGENYNFTYRDGFIDWENFFNELPIEFNDADLD